MREGLGRRGEGGMNAPSRADIPCRRGRLVDARMAARGGRAADIWQKRGGRRRKMNPSLGSGNLVRPKKWVNSSAGGAEGEGRRLRG